LLFIAVVLILIVADERGEKILKLCEKCNVEFWYQNNETGKKHYTKNDPFSNAFNIQNRKFLLIKI